MDKLHTPVCPELVCFVKKQRKWTGNAAAAELCQGSELHKRYLILAIRTFKFSHPCTSGTT